MSFTCFMTRTVSAVFVVVDVYLSFSESEFRSNRWFIANPTKKELRSLGNSRYKWWHFVVYESAAFHSSLQHWNCWSHCVQLRWNSLFNPNGTTELPIFPVRESSPLHPVIAFMRPAVEVMYTFNYRESKYNIHFFDNLVPNRPSGPMGILLKLKVAPNRSIYEVSVTQKYKQYTLQLDWGSIWCQFQSQTDSHWTRWLIWN